ncbi:MAG: Stp1/IreP family PP2C-type Ser/Thr phosphatase [Ruminococcaceae bacterium]|nr:Stp1/IreP family PP2C-type Ser/Thr phosphatase [Oscillospiraceae bacterium]
MNSFGITDRGKVRLENQDSFIIERFDDRNAVLAVLCDGMGGERAGNLASELAAKTFVSTFSQRLNSSSLKNPDCIEMMGNACEAANNMVYSYSCFDKGYTGMGTTLVAALLIGNRTFILNVGDSRAYKISKNKIKQISRDHSLVQELIDNGEITQDEAKIHPRRSVITRALGVNEQVPFDMFRPLVFPGNKILLCSDGLSNMVEDSEILELSQINTDPLSLGNALLYKAMDRGARDNVTIVIITK